jgi:hypothetical protein
VAEGTILGATLRFVLFAGVALIGPAFGLFRLLRLKIDPALLLPVALAQSSLFYFLSLRCGAPWLFVLLVAALDIVAIAPPWTLARAPGPSLRGAIPAFLAVVLVFALTEYGGNRLGPRGEFVFDNVVPEDSAFHVGLAWELSVSYPPDVPGLSGIPMGYHLGLPLVRGAGIRFAHLHPYDLMSRFEITLVALGLILALREAARQLGASPFAIALVPWTLLATDFSFVFFRNSSIDFWINATDSDLLFSLGHANSSVAAIIVALGALIALERFLAAEGRGFLVLGVLLGAAVPHFKVFVGAQYLFGLAAALLLTRRVREGLLLGLPALFGLLVLVLGQGGANMEVRVDPLLIVQKLRASLGLGAIHGGGLLAWTLLWIVASLGLRLFGIPEAFKALLSRKFAPAALAGMALLGWPVGMLFRVTPLQFPGRPPYNEAWYFIEQSAPFLALFAAIALARLRLPRGLCLTLLACLSLPSTIQFVLAKRATPKVTAPPAIVEAMGALSRVTAPGEVVLERPEPRRYPPPPMVLLGRRVPYARFIPYLYQVAPPRELHERIETVRRFFKTTDPQEALRVARELGARYVCLFGEDDVAFPREGILRAIYEKENARVYEIVGGAEGTK